MKTPKSVGPWGWRLLFEPWPWLRAASIFAHCRAFPPRWRRPICWARRSRWLRGFSDAWSNEPEPFERPVQRLKNTISSNGSGSKPGHPIGEHPKNPLNKKIVGLLCFVPKNLSDRLWPTASHVFFKVLLSEASRRSQPSFFRLVWAAGNRWVIALFGSNSWLWLTCWVSKPNFLRSPIFGVSKPKIWGPQTGVW